MKAKKNAVIQLWKVNFTLDQVFLTRFRDPIRVPRISNRVPRIREIGSLRIHTGYLTFSFKKPALGQKVLP